MIQFYKHVRGLGNVALSRHAQAQLTADGVTDLQVAETLAHGEDTPEGGTVIWRRWNGIRLVIQKKPTPFSGAALVLTAFREQHQAKAKP
jgi:hypothetical protein